MIQRQRRKSTAAHFKVQLNVDTFGDNPMKEI